MIRVINFVSTSLPVELLPNPGQLWRVLNAAVLFETSATAGTRRVFLVTSPFQGSVVGPILLDSGGLTGTNTEYTLTGGITNSSGAQYDTFWYDYPLVHNYGGLVFSGNLLGDQFTVYLLIEVLQA